MFIYHLFAHTCVGWDELLSVLLNRCPECGSLEVYYDAKGNLVCKNCGVLPSKRRKEKSHFLEVKKVEQLKRGSSKVNERSTGLNSAGALGWSANARLSNNRKNTQNLQCLLRTEYYLPTSECVREEGVLKKRVEYEQQATEESLQTDNSRTELDNLHGGFA
jgi:DNA-directed RNA polymerase subunit M/transcription elongation factor TFIIS